jgi:hypothetical protein
MMTRSHRQEALSRAYVRAIAAKAGVICSEPEQDYGIDMSLRAVRVRNQRFGDVGGQVDVQLKSTTRAAVSSREVTYDLDVKHYDDLRVEGDNCPRILVLFILPVEEAEWLSQTTEELVLRHCAYWMSLEGFPASTSTSTIRIHIPTSNVFSVDALQTLLAWLRERKKS